MAVDGPTRLTGMGCEQQSWRSRFLPELCRRRPDAAPATRRSWGRQLRCPVEGGEDALGLPVEEELDDFPVRAAREHLVEVMERGPNNLRSRRFRIAGVTKKVTEGVDPFGIGRVE